MNIVKLNKVNLQWLGTVNEGKRLEIVSLDSENIPISGVPYPLATILADEETEELMIEIYTEEGIVQFPLSNLKKIIAASEGEVHSEAWYEKNVYNEDKNT